MTSTAPAAPGGPAVPAAPLRIVVVTYAPGDSLDAFLASLPAATRLPYEVVLADNGSPAGPTAADDAVLAAAARPGIRLLSTGGNVGYGRAANAGAFGHTGPWLVVANPDVVWHPGALDTLLDAADRWPRAGSLGPGILTPEGDLYPSARALPSLGRGIGHAALGWVWADNPWTRAYRREQGRPEEGPAGWLSGSCLLLRTEAFDAVGGFDPSFWMYFEDLDLGARLTDAGWQNVYVPTAVVAHEGGHASRRTPKLMLKAHHRSAYLYLSRVYAGPQHLLTRLVLRAGLALRYLVATLPGTVGAKVGEGARPTRPGSALPAEAASGVDHTTGAGRPESAPGGRGDATLGGGEHVRTGGTT
ncbi:MAG: glycosyltransferase [Mycobacterium sp.]|nr:glycosyltransferase [Mycobacterium sp.]